MAQIERVIDKALAAAEQSEQLTMTQIEEVALAARAEIGKQLTTVLVEPARQQAVPGPSCPDCGQEMEYKGQKRHYVRTRSGEIAVERGYYYCRECHSGIFPPR
jgi:hypothetical protein